MEYPKLAILSDGQHTSVLLDGVILGKGIERLDFSTKNENGEMKSMIRFFEVDVGTVTLERIPDFKRMLSGFGKK